MFDVSPVQVLLVLALALIVFGPKRLPELGRNLGTGIRDFKGGLTGDDADRVLRVPAERVAAEPDAAGAPVVQIAAEAPSERAR